MSNTIANIAHGQIEAAVKLLREARDEIEHRYPKTFAALDHAAVLAVLAGEDLIDEDSDQRDRDRDYARQERADNADAAQDEHDREYRGDDDLQDALHGRTL